MNACYRRFIAFGLILLPYSTISCSHAPPTSVPAVLSPEKQLVNSIAKNPNDPSPRLSLVPIYAAAGNTHSAIQQAEIAGKLGPLKEEDLFFLQNLLRSVGEAELASQVLAADKSSFSSSPEFRLQLSRAYLDIGDFNRAGQALFPLLSSPDMLSNDEKIEASRTLLMANDFAKAAILIPKSDNDPENLAVIGFANSLQGSYKNAIKALSKSCRLNPQDAWNTTLLGNAELAVGDKQGAYLSFQKAILLSNPPPIALINAAELMIEKGETHEASDILRKIPSELQKDPAFWEAQVKLSHALNQPIAAEISRGYAAFYSGDPWLAESIWQNILPKAAGEDSSELHAAIFNSAYLRQDAEVSMKIMKDAVLKWPQKPYFAHKHAELYLGQNMLKESLAEAERYKKLAGSNEGYAEAELLCSIALDSGNHELLVQNAKIARELAPSAPEPILHLAEWQLNQGRSKENLEATLNLYLEAISVAPRSAEARARAGIVLNDLNRPEEAEEQLLKALSIDPRIMDGTANFTLAQIYQKQGRSAESQYEQSEYQRLLHMKDGWLALMKSFRLPAPASVWKQLGERALERHDNWIALCAFHRAASINKSDPSLWRCLAAAQKRMGRFDESMNSMLRSNKLSGSK